MLFREEIAICCENHVKHINTLSDTMQIFSVLKQVVPVGVEGLMGRWIEMEVKENFNVPVSDCTSEIQRLQDDSG
jgi:hypothetical protein